METNNETVEQVCEEMHGVKTGQHANGGRLYERFLMKCQIAEDYADRIEAAHKREMAEKDAEIAKLQATLLPVLNVRVSANTSPEESAHRCMMAVSESMRIWCGLAKTKEVTK